MTRPGDPGGPPVKVAKVLPFRRKMPASLQPQRFDFDSDNGLVGLTIVSGGCVVAEWEMEPKAARYYAEQLQKWAAHVERLRDSVDPRSPLLKQIERVGGLPALEAMAARRWLKVEAILAPTSAPAMEARDELWAMLLRLHPDRGTWPEWSQSGSSLGEWFEVSPSTVLRRARAWVASQAR